MEELPKLEGCQKCFARGRSRVVPLHDKLETMSPWLTTPLALSNL